MHITYLFGNGLDLAWGLKTSYMDFYNYLDVLSKDDESLKNNLIYSKLLEDKNNHKIELWSDYEKRLGEITTIVTDDNKQKFEDDKTQLDLLLQNYLKIEESKIEMNSDESLNIITGSFIELVQCHRPSDSNLIVNILKQHPSQPFYFNIISFNYTKTISLMFNHKENAISTLKIAQYPSGSYNSHLLNPFYLHGTLDDGQMVIGIDNNEQIANVSLRNDDFSYLMIKTNLLEESGYLHLEKFTQTINGSNGICIYGLSVGATDSTYWEIIKKRLLADFTILVIYSYIAGYDQTQRHIAKDRRIREKIRNQFFENSNATDDEKNILKDKIIVEINHPLFTRDIIKDK